MNKMNKMNWIYKYVNYNLIIFLIILSLEMNTYFFMNSIFFDEYIVETCKVSLQIFENNSQYNDIEFVIFYKKDSKFENINLFEYFNDWTFLTNPRRCFLYLNGNWLNGEMINGFIFYNGNKLEFRLLITYQDTDKYNMHMKDNIFPLLLNLEKMEIILRPPFKKWFCELSTITSDLENLIHIYNSFWKLKKTVFILSEDKQYGQLLYLKKDYWQQYFDYTTIFKKK